MIQAQKQSQTRTRVIGAAAAAVVVIALLYFFGPLGGSDSNTSKLNASKSTTSAVKKTTSSSGAKAPGAGDPKTCPPEGGTATRFTTFATAPKMCIDTGKKYTALMKTDAGDITITLNPKTTPKTANNFVFLARNHFYDSILFHRVIPDFVDQGGDPEGTGAGGPGYKFADEIPDGYKYTEGDVAMANSGPDTNGSQFFLVASQNGADQLLAAVGGVAKYTPFGHVTAGLDIVKSINADGDESGKPTKQHKIISVTITEG